MYWTKKVDSKIVLYFVHDIIIIVLYYYNIMLINEIRILELDAGTRT